MTQRFFFLFAISKNAWKSLAVLIVGVFIAVIATLNTQHSVEDQLNKEFGLVCHEIKAKIESRLHSHALLLRSGSALFSVSDTVTRADWKEFSECLKISLNLPGIQGIGYSLIIPKNHLQQHIQRLRNEGFSDYTVKPGGDRAVYTSIIYLEPFSGRNLRAFGYDMLSERIRKEAMEGSRDSDIALLSGKVILVQESNQDVQIGTLMYVPVYCNGMPVTTVEQRRTAIKGWVYSPYRMNDLMQGILGQRDVNLQGFMRLQVYDEKKSINSILYDSQGKDTLNHEDKPKQIVMLRVEFNGKTWILYFTRFAEQTPLFRSSVLIVFISGILISLLLFALSLAMLNTQYRAKKIAVQLTSTLQESEERYRTVVEWSPYMIVIHRQGKIVYVNPAAIKTFGATSEQDLVGTFIRDRLHPDFHQIVQERVQKAIDDGVNAPMIEVTYFKLDGTTIDGEVVGLPIIYDGGPAIYAAINDISDRKRSNVLLKEASARLSLATRAGGVGVWDYDIVNNILLWDDQMFSLYGINKNDFEGVYEAWQAGVHPDDKERGNAEIQKAINGEKEFNTEFRVLWPDGNTHNIRALAVVQRDSSGNPLHMIGTNWDITASKQAEIVIRTYNETLEQRVAERTKQLEFHLKEIEQFTYIASHDLSEPLHALTNFTNLIHEEYSGKLDEDGNKSIDFIYHSAIRMRLLLKGLLDYSLLGKDSVMSDVDCNKVVAEVLSDLSVAIKSCEASITIQELPVINGYSAELNLLFQNLIHNAIKFRKKNIPPVIKISAENHGTELAFSITDNGIGVKKQDQEKVFIIFKRMVKRNEFEGMGIGLAHCKKIVELHGGRIWVESNKEGGSTFMFTIPA